MRVILAGLMISMLAGCGASSTPNTTRSGPAGIDAGVYQPYDKANFPRIFKNYGSKGVVRIDKLRISAAQTVAQKPECDFVEMSELSENRSTIPNVPVVFVDCRNGQRYYFSESDIGTVPKSETEKGQQISATTATQMCTSAVKDRLKYPSEFRKDYFSVATRQADITGNWIIDFDFKAMNGLGLKLPASAHCTINTKMQTEVTLIE